MKATAVTSNNMHRKQLEAARLIALGGMSVAEIADKLGVQRTTLWRWQQKPDFRKEIVAQNFELDKEAFATGLARKRTRVGQLADMADRVRLYVGSHEEMDPALIREWRLLIEAIGREMCV